MYVPGNKGNLLHVTTPCDYILLPNADEELSSLSSPFPLVSFLPADILYEAG